MKLDLLTADIQQLRTLLNNGSLNSLALVEAYLVQIQKYNGYLKAVIRTAPPSLITTTAEQLDQERRDGKLRGPLHGIPVILKV